MRQNKAEASEQKMWFGVAGILTHKPRDISQWRVDCTVSEYYCIDPPIQHTKKLLQSNNFGWFEFGPAISLFFLKLYICFPFFPFIFLGIGVGMAGPPIPVPIPSLVTGAFDIYPKVHPNLLHMLFPSFSRSHGWEKMTWESDLFSLIVFQVECPPANGIWEDCLSVCISWVTEPVWFVKSCIQSAILYLFNAQIQNPEIWLHVISLINIRSLDYTNKSTCMCVVYCMNTEID